MNLGCILEKPGKKSDGFNYNLFPESSVREINVAYSKIKCNGKI